MSRGNQGRRTPFLVATLRVFLAGLREDTADLAAILYGVVTVVGALDSSESLSRVVLVVWLLNVLQLLPKIRLSRSNVHIVSYRT